MGVVVKEVKVKNFIPVFLTQSLSNVIGKLRIQTYEEIEIIRAKKKELAEEVDKIREKAGNDNKKLNELWNGPSEVTKEQFAWLTKDEFKAVILGLGLKADEVLLLDDWIVK